MGKAPFLTYFLLPLQAAIVCGSVTQSGALVSIDNARERERASERARERESKSERARESEREQEREGGRERESLRHLAFFFLRFSFFLIIVFILRLFRGGGGGVYIYCNPSLLPDVLG